MKVLVIVNPNSGRRKILKYIDKIENNIKEANVDYKIVYTTIKNNAQKILEEYNDEVDLVIACGGDGTINETLNGIMVKDKDITMSFIPVGTMNDFAKTIKMPTNKEKLSKEILDLEIKKVDVGKINEKHFCYVAGFGLCADVGYITPQKLKNVLGWLAYYLVAIKKVFSFKSNKLILECNGEKIEGDYLFGMISNSVSVAGLRWFKRENISLSDGLFEVLLIKKPKNVLGYLRIIKGFFTKKYTEKNNFYFSRSNDIKVHSYEEMPWTIDGEYAGKMKFADIKCENKNVEFAIPKRR